MSYRIPKEEYKKLKKFYNNRDSSDFDFHTIDINELLKYRHQIEELKLYPYKIRWLVENGYVDYQMISPNEEDGTALSCFYTITEKGKVAIEEKIDLDCKFWIPTVLSITAIILTLAQLFLTYGLPYLIKPTSPIP